MESFQLASGRSIGATSLLFVTSRATLCELEKDPEFTSRSTDPCGALAQAAIAAAVRPPHVLEVLENAATFDQALSAIKEVLQRHNTVDGVVLIGGYSTLPAEIKHVIIPHSTDPHSGEHIECPGNVEPNPGTGPETHDSDHYIVWSDDFYGDNDDDGYPELPVSRIPCSTRFSLVRNALKASGGSVSTKLFGIRDGEYDFGEEVYDQIVLWSNDPALPIDMTSFPNVNEAHLPLIPEKLSVNSLYVTGHGSEPPSNSEWITSISGNDAVVSAVTLHQAANSANPISPFGRVVFGGCCFSGLVAKDTAYEVREDRRLNQCVVPVPVPLSLEDVAPENSVAMGFLNLGIIAVVGFVGVHWVPLDGQTTVMDVPPHLAKKFMGRPLHDLFWRNYLQFDMPPAKALFEAKAEYAAGMPYLRLPVSDAEANDSSVSRNESLNRFFEAVELKTFWSATCLGLGW